MELNVKKAKRRKEMKLFATAFLQVFFVAGNTYFISQKAWFGIALFSFAISYLWTVNVKSITASTLRHRLAYASGAMCGGLLGVYVTGLIIK